MGWKEAQKRYQDLETLNDQKDEDLIARRVLKGLSIPVKQLHTVERRLFGDPQFDTALWPRAKRVLEYALRIERNALMRAWRLEVCESNHTHKEVLERFEMALTNKEDVRPVFLTRFKDTTSSFTYSAWQPVDTAALKPPYSAVADIGRWRIVLQETEAFIGWLGLKIVFEEALHNEES